MGQISITFQSSEAVESAIRELAAVLERAKHHNGVEVLPAHFKGVETVSALGISQAGRKIQRVINFERGILTAKTDCLDRPFNRS